MDVRLKKDRLKRREKNQALRELITIDVIMIDVPRAVVLAVVVSDMGDVALITRGVTTLLPTLADINVNRNIGHVRYKMIRTTLRMNGIDVNHNEEARLGRDLVGYIVIRTTFPSLRLIQRSKRMK